MFIANVLQEISLHALHPLSEDLVVETDFYIWMQQDDSANSSVIQVFRVKDMQPLGYTYICNIMPSLHLQNKME